MTKYKNQAKVDTILQDYNQTQLSRIQVTKQADLQVLLFMMEDLFPYEIKKACWKYYEPKTTHDSSLSYSTHCVMASDMDNPMTYRLFYKSWAIDMGEIMTTSDAGIHAAAMGGIWQCVVMGFGGVRLSEQELRIEPRLPDSWRALHFNLHYQGDILKNEEIRVDSEVQVHVKNLTDNKTVEFLLQGEKALV